MSSYNSHYVLVNASGMIPDYENDELFDEIVIPQESQVTPAYVVKVATEGLPKAMKRWNKRKSRCSRSDRTKSTKVDRTDASKLSTAMQPLDIDESNMLSARDESQDFPLVKKKK